MPRVPQLLAVPIGRYDAHHALDAAVPVTRDLTKVLVDGGYTPAYEELVEKDVKLETVTAAVKTWLDARGTDDDVLVYWTGHGVRTVDGQLLVVSDSPPAPLADEAVDPKLLFQRLLRSKAPRGLLIIDTCFSGKAGTVVSDFMARVKESQLPPSEKRIAILTSSHPERTVPSPVFGDALAQVLGDPESGAASWGRSEQWIGLGALRQALDAAIAPAAGIHLEVQAWEARPTGWAVDDTGGSAWLRNPRWVGSGVDELVELRRAVGTTAAEHWDVSGRGLDVGTSGWAFVGRTAPLTRLVDWLRSGVAVVTGPPGAGRSSQQGCNPAGGSPAMSIAHFRHVAIPHPGTGNRPGDAWCKRPGCSASRRCCGGCNLGV